jgi:hypothetical protein
MLNIILIISALLNLTLVLKNVVESVYQLSQTPNLSTFGKCKQVVINFFTTETYGGVK